MIKQLAESVFHIRAYPEFTRQKRGPFSYSLLLTALYFCLAILIPVTAFFVRAGGYSGLVRQYCPDFVFESGELTVEEPICLNVEDVYLDIDTERSFLLEDVRDPLSEKDFAIVVDQNKCYVHMDNEDHLYSFDDYAWINISRDMILSMEKDLYRIGACMLIMLYLFTSIGFYILMRILGLLMLLIMRFVVDEPRPGYRGATVICVRAATLPVIILAAAPLITKTFLNMEFVWNTAQGVWVVYMIAAVYFIMKESERLHEQYVDAYRSLAEEDARRHGERYEDRMYEDRMYTDDMYGEESYTEKPYTDDPYADRQKTGYR